MAGQFGRWLRRLTSDEEQLEADSLLLDTVAAGARAAGDCCAGERVEICGKLRTVELQPSDGLAAVVAELYDGTDAVDLVWLGRRTIAGIEAGRSLRATGRIALRDGHKAMFNPSYRLLPVTT